MNNMREGESIAKGIEVRQVNLAGADRARIISHQAHVRETITHRLPVVVNTTPYQVKYEIAGAKHPEK
jgi:hypothetical protein